MYEFSSKPTNFTRVFSCQNLPTLRAPSVAKTCQLYAYLQLPKPTNFTRTFSCQNLPTLCVSSVPKTYQLYAHLQFPKPANFTCTSRLQHLSILRISSVSNIQNPCPGFHSSDSLMLAPLAKMRSSIYAGFREGPPTLVNIAGVNA